MRVSSKREANLEYCIQQSGIRESSLRAHRRACLSALAGPLCIDVHPPKTGGSSQWHSIANAKPPDLAVVDLYSSAIDPWTLEVELTARVAQRAAMVLKRWGED